MSEIIFLSNVRLSFPHLVEPHTSTEGAPKKYSADFIMAPNHPGFAQFMQQYATLAQGKWAEHANAIMNMINGDRKVRCYGNENDKIAKKTLKPYDGYIGNVYISASKDTSPQMIQADGSAVDPANTMAYQALARKLYGGCYVNAAIRPWLQDNKHGRGVRCELFAIQFAADGEPFGEGDVDASNLFGAVASQSAAPAAPAGLPSFFQPQ